MRSLVVDGCVKSDLRGDGGVVDGPLPSETPVRAPLRLRVSLRRVPVFVVPPDRRDDLDLYVLVGAMMRDSGSRKGVEGVMLYRRVA